MGDCHSAPAATRRRQSTLQRPKRVRVAAAPAATAHEAQRVVQERRAQFTSDRHLIFSSSRLLRAADTVLCGEVSLEVASINEGLPEAEVLTCAQQERALTEIVCSMKAGNSSSFSEIVRRAAKKNGTSHKWVLQELPVFKRRLQSALVGTRHSGVALLDASDPDYSKQRLLLVREYGVSLYAFKAFRTHTFAV